MWKDCKQAEKKEHNRMEHQEKRVNWHTIEEHKGTYLNKRVESEQNRTERTSKHYKHQNKKHLNIRCLTIIIITAIIKIQKDYQADGCPID